MVLAAVMFGQALLAPPLHAATASAQAQLKAALIFNVTKLVRFPNPAATELTICPLHPQSEVSLALRALDGRSSQGRLIRVLRGGESEALTSCDVVYFSRDDSTGFREVLSSLSGHSVLTISDIDDFAEAGGMVGIVTDVDRLSLKINGDSARRANIGFAAQLLGLAKIIRNAEPP